MKRKLDILYWQEKKFWGFFFAKNGVTGNIKYKKNLNKKKTQELEKLCKLAFLLKKVTSL